MSVKGVFASDQNIPGTEVAGFPSAILRLQPEGSAPMVAMSSGMKSVDTKQTVITWFEKTHFSGLVNITNNAGTGTSFTLSNGDEVVADTIMLIQSTGEYVFVQSVVGDVATVKRGFASSTVTAINGSVTPVTLQRVVTAKAEGSAKPESVVELGYPRFNYQHIVRTSWDATRTAKSVNYATGDVVAQNRSEAGMIHAEDLERALLWSKQFIGSKDGKPLRAMDGFTNQVTSNIFAQNTNTTMDDIEKFLLSIFEKKIQGLPNERIAYGGNIVLSVLSKLAMINGSMNIDVGQTDFGLKVTRWITNYGTISILTHPLMNENPFWQKDLYVMHPGAVTIHYLDRTFHDANDRDGTRAGADADFGVYTTEFCLQYAGEKTAGIYRGIDTAAA